MMCEFSVFESITYLLFLKEFHVLLSYNECKNTADKTCMNRNILIYALYRKFVKINVPKIKFQFILILQIFFAVNKNINEISYGIGCFWCIQLKLKILWIMLDKLNRAMLSIFCVRLTERIERGTANRTWLKISFKISFQFVRSFRWYFFCLISSCYYSFMMLRFICESCTVTLT